MATQKALLTAAKVDGKLAAGTIRDRDGLLLIVSDKGSKRWTQQVSIQGVQRSLGLGSYPLVSLADARGKAAENYRVAKAGGDPRTPKVKAAKATAAPTRTAPTFREISERVMDLKAPTITEIHCQKSRRSLEIHVYPVIGEMPIAEITSAEILELMSGLWHSIPVRAKHILNMISATFEFGKVAGVCAGNPAASMARALPKQTRKPNSHKAIPYSDIPAAMAEVRDLDTRPSGRLALQFLVLTGARSEEVRGMEWAEVDFESKSWTVPAWRMKARRPHRVPLADAALDILAEAKELGGTTLVFPGTNGKGVKPMQVSVFQKLMKALDLDGVPHGFRSSFRDWTAEQTATPEAVAEAALAHQRGDKTEAAYFRSDLFERRRVLMDAWADYVLP